MTRGNETLIAITPQNNQQQAEIFDTHVGG